MLGRNILPDEDQPGHANDMILSYGLWTRRFNADASVIGAYCSPEYALGYCCGKVLNLRLRFAIKDRNRAIMSVGDNLAWLASPAGAFVISAG
jgi:hypothetical protein